MLNLQSIDSFKQCQSCFTLSYTVWRPDCTTKEEDPAHGAGGMVEESCSYCEALLGVGEYTDPGLCHMEWCTGISPSKVQCLI